MLYFIANRFASLTPCYSVIYKMRQKFICLSS